MPLPRTVQIESGSATLPGDLAVPEDAGAIVVFAHGSGSSRLSPRNVAVADRLNRAGYATLLLDLLTPREALDRARVFDIELLATRLAGAARWVRSRLEIAELPLAFFGASTGAAAGLVAAAALGDDVAAIVSRGGRPDLAGDALERVQAPTLLIVGGEDPDVLELNRATAGRMRAETRIVVIPGAGHLFEEEGALERVAELAADWITEHLTTTASRHSPHRGVR
jgi:putative phosphoribosyl transferase